MLLAMDATVINAKDFIDEKKPVVDAAAQVGDSAAAVLRAGGSVVVSVEDVRGVSSTFFNVILSRVAPVLRNDFGDGRFEVQTGNKTQALIYQRSLDAIKSHGPQ